jgi:hypothetical protein
MIENKIPLPWALTVVASIFVISIGLLSMCGSWESILEEAKTVEIDIFGAGSESEVVAGQVNGENGDAINGEKGENKTIDA